MRLLFLCAAATIALPVLAMPFAPIPMPMPPASAIAAPLMPPAATAPETGTPLVGTYDCQGVEPDGTPYRGVVQIVPNEGTYDVIWIFASGQQYSGLGVVNGDVLAVSYFTNRPGVVAYKIHSGDNGPRLQGQWTVVGAGKVFRETLTRVSENVKRPERSPEPQRRHPPRLLRHLRPA